MFENKVKAFQIKNQKYNDVDVFYNEILNGQGLRMPPRTLDGIPMTAQQYNDYIIKTNSITIYPTCFFWAKGRRGV